MLRIGLCSSAPDKTSFWNLGSFMGGSIGKMYSCCTESPSAYFQISNDRQIWTEWFLIRSWISNGKENSARNCWRPASRWRHLPNKRRESEGTRRDAFYRQAAGRLDFSPALAPARR